MFASHVKVAALVSLLLESPLIVLELMANWNAGIRAQDFIALFGFLWTIGFAIVLIFLLVANRLKLKLLNSSGGGRG